MNIDDTKGPKMPRVDVDWRTSYADIRNAALEEACGVIDGYGKYDQSLCCDGLGCGCYGSSVHDEIKHYIRALKSSPKRCAECDCEKGGKGCNWIASPAPQPSVQAAVKVPDDCAPDWEGFGRDLMEHWPVRDVCGSELFEAALRNGLILEIPGGYDPEQHIDAEGICPETGDPWYEYAFRALAQKEGE